MTNVLIMIGEEFARNSVFEVYYGRKSNKLVTFCAYVNRENNRIIKLVMQPSKKRTR